MPEPQHGPDYPAVRRLRRSPTTTSTTPMAMRTTRASRSGQLLGVVTASTPAAAKNTAADTNNRAIVGHAGRPTRAQQTVRSRCVPPPCSDCIRPLPDIGCLTESWPKVEFRSSDLEFARGLAATLLAMARPLASALSARPSAVHRSVPLRGRGNRRRPRPGRPGGWRTRRCLGARAGRCGCPRCRRPWSRRCCTPSHLERWVQASVRVGGAAARSWVRDRVEGDLVRFLVAPVREPAALAHDHETALRQHANRRGVVARSAGVERTSCLQLQELP